MSSTHRGSPSPSPPTRLPSSSRHSWQGPAQLRRGQRLLCWPSPSRWDTALSLSLCFLLFIVLAPASRPCANAPFPANLNSFQGRLHKSRAVAGSQACWAGCFVLSAPAVPQDLLARTPLQRSQQDASWAVGGAAAAKSNRGQGQAWQI